MAVKVSKQTSEQLFIAIVPEEDLTSATALDPGTGTVVNGEVTGASGDVKMHQMNHAGVSIAGPKNYVASDDIDPDARQGNVVFTGETATLSFACDYQPGGRGAVEGVSAEDHALVGSLHLFEQAASGNLWTAPIAISSSAVTASNAAGVNTLVGAAGDFDDLVGLSAITGQPIVPCPGRLIRVGGTPLDDLVTVLSISGALAAVQTLVIGSGDPSGGGNLSDGQPGVDVGAVAAGDLVTLEHDGVLKTGNADQWLLGERAIPTIPQFTPHYGSLVNSMGWAVAKGGIPKVSIALSGLLARTLNATSGDAAFYQRIKFPSYEPGDKFARYALDGVYGLGPLDDAVTGITPRMCDWSLAAEANAIDALGRDGLAAQVGDKRTWTGTTSLFNTLAARDITAQVMNNDRMSLFFAVQQTDGKAAVPTTQMECVWFTCIALNDASSVTGKHGETSFPWQAGPHPGFAGLEFAKARFANTTPLA